MRFTTKTFSTVGDFSSAVSTVGLRANGAPFLKPPSAVITNFAWASLFRTVTASAEKPPKITECMAPIRAQANIAIAASGIIGI
ncbi:unannotated protein [freshwater metagenome]|uniref:Unannotated protein n=1 Tax=freshwater metagenome TaxID=449393 RepID=A0A6J6C2Y6_9ZZZZ